MRKTVLGFIASFMLLSAHAQDLKIKKGEVLLGGTPVALVKEAKRVCDLSTPDGKKVFTFFIKNKASSHQKTGSSSHHLRAQSLNCKTRKTGLYCPPRSTLSTNC